MIKIFIILVLILFFQSCGLMDIAEHGYFEGQKDALRGDVRIKADMNGCWHWSKSPWDDGATPRKDISKICDEK